MKENKKPMICIHSHILPVDDGADDLDMTKVMLLKAIEEKICRIIATPHSEAFDRDTGQIGAAFREAAAYRKELPVYLGCEVYCEGSVMKKVLNALEQGVYPTLNATGYLLMELSPWTTPEDAKFCVRTVADAGYIPVLAHVERYKNLRGKMDQIQELQNLGARLQVNVGSLDCWQKDPVCEWARELVLQKKADFLGTDSHNTYSRPPSPQRGLSWLWEMVKQGRLDREYAEDLSVGNAEKLLIKKEENDNETGTDFVAGENR